MKYLLIGLLISIGWHLGQLLLDTIQEVVFNRLHMADWYCRLIGKPARKSGVNKSGKEAKIGF